MTDNSVNIKNKKARYEYELLDEYTAGIMLLGTEIKSIRNSKASIVEAYCAFKKDELFIRNMNIAEYDHGGFVNHLPKRERKLLLNKTELKKIKKGVDTKGHTVVPTLLYISKNGLAKLKIWVAKGKKLHDKRDDIKDKDVKRDLDRLRKNF